MSRALTVFSRKEAAMQVDNLEVEKIMEKLGCSEPVAKNMIKYAKLGIGPLAGQGGPGDEGTKMSDRARRSQEEMPPRIDKKTAALIAEQKLRERQEAEERDAEMQRLAGKKKNGGLARLGPVMARNDEVGGPVISKVQKEEQPEELRGMFEQARPVAKKAMQIGGITQLKPIVREEEADSREKASGSKGEEPDDDENPYDKWMADEAQKRQNMDKHRQRDREDKHSSRRKRKRGRSSDDDEARNGKRLRSASRGREDSDAAGGSGGGGGLMSEAQVMKLMKKQKGSERGSVRAQSRIQKEKEEWEQRKANNPEFWKAPQFALCYSAETGKRARGAG